MGHEGIPFSGCVRMKRRIGTALFCVLVMLIASSADVVADPWYFTLSTGDVDDTAVDVTIEQVDDYDHSKSADGDDLVIYAGGSLDFDDLTENVPVRHDFVLERGIWIGGNFVVLEDQHWENPHAPIYRPTFPATVPSSPGAGRSWPSYERAWLSLPSASLSCGTSASGSGRSPTGAWWCWALRPPSSE